MLNFINSQSTLLRFTINRYLAFGVSFIMSLIYSNLLGLTNRAIMGFVFLVSGVLINFFTLGFGLQILALHRKATLTRNHVHQYIISATFFLVIALGFLNSLLYYFLSSLKSLRPTIFVVVSLYFCVSFVCQLFYDFLLRTHQYTKLNVYMLAQCFLSICLFFSLFYFLRITVFVSIFISLSLSFIIPSIWFFFQDKLLMVSLLSTIKIKQNAFALFREKNDFLKSAIKSFLIVVGDKFDRVLILMLLPLEVFAKVLVAQSFLFFLKPINDLVLNHDIGLRRTLSTFLKFFWFASFIAVSALFLPIIYRIIVFYFLGEEWLLASNVFLLLFGFEIIRQSLLIRYIRSVIL